MLFHIRTSAALFAPPISPKCGTDFFGGNNDSTQRFKVTELTSMELTKLTEIELPAAFDAHVHLRDGEMSQLVTPTIRKGGVNQVYVMVSSDFSIWHIVFLLAFDNFCLFILFSLTLLRRLQSQFSYRHYIQVTFL
jgi:hypothetical protein